MPGLKTEHPKSMAIKQNPKNVGLEGITASLSPYTKAGLSIPRPSLTAV